MESKPSALLESVPKVMQLFSVEGMDGEVVLTFCLVFVITLICLTKLISYIQRSLEAARWERDETLIVQPPQPSYNRSEEPCPICYSTIGLAVETNCLHLFCGTCMLELIQYARHRNLSCPVCRASVLMLYPLFTVDEYNLNGNSATERTRDNLIREIQEYNHLFSGGRRTLMRTLFELPVYIRRLWRSFHNPNDVLVQNRMKKLLYIILFLVILYILFPFDLFPEVYFGILGLLDDILVLAMSLVYVTSVYRNLFFNLEHNN